MILNYISDHAPLEILQNIASQYSEESGPDFRATITIFTANGTSWRGIPIAYCNQNQGSYLVLQTKEMAAVSLYTHQITSVEISDQRILESFISRPWQTSERFSSISKMQLMREIETEWKEIGPSLEVQFDGFPKEEYIFGATLAWIVSLKSVLKKIVLEFPDALTGYRAIEVHFSDLELNCTKVDNKLKIKSNFKKNSFSRTLLYEELNRSL